MSGALTTLLVTISETTIGVMFVSAVESFDAYYGDQRMKKKDKKRWIIKKSVGPSTFCR